MASLSSSSPDTQRKLVSYPPKLERRRVGNGIRHVAAVGMQMPLAAFLAIALIVQALAEAQGNPTVTVGAWTIATAYRADKFDSCTMNRSATEPVIVAALGQAKRRIGAEIVGSSAALTTLCAHKLEQ